MRILPAPVAVVLALTFALTSCASSPSASPDVSGDPTGARAVDTISVTADAFVLSAAGDEVASLPATDVEETVSGLTAVLGPPVTTTFDAGECTGAYTRHSWDDVLTIDDREMDFVGDYSARIYGSELPSEVTGDPVRVEGPIGEQVGDDIARFTAAIDPELVEGFEEAAIVILQRGWPEIAFPVGVAAFTENGRIDNLGMPIAVNSGLDC